MTEDTLPAGRGRGFVPGRRVRIAWMAATVLVAVLLLTLAGLVKANPESQVDRDLLREIGTWGAEPLGGWYDVMSRYSGQWPAVMTMFAAVFVTMLIGRVNNGVALALTLALVGGLDLLVGYGLGSYVGVDRPTGGSRSFPSGHVAYITSAALMLLYVARLKRFPALAVLLLVPITGFMMYSSGVSRIYQAAHWPSDVLGGYLLGLLGPLVFIPVYHWFERVRWVTPQRVGIDVPAPETEDAVIAGSYGSAVVIEPSLGTATKWFDPPVLLRVLYWLSFQKGFPYVNNEAAIDSAIHRRKIAALLTQYRFGQSRVAQITDVRWNDSHAGLVTEYVAGAEPESNVAAWDFLGAVHVLFEEAGLPGWQLDPHNPHAHTNLVRRPDGQFVIIDMESGFVTPFPSRSRFRSSLKHGTLPVFDDIDFDRLRHFAADRESDLRRTLGDLGYAQLQDSIVRGESAYVRWHLGEPRIWGRTIRWVYRAVNIRADFAFARRGMAGAQQRAVSYLEEGVSAWESERRITHARAAAIRRSLSEPAIAVALEHLGAHMMISVVFRFPLGSIIRALWVLTFMVKASDALVRRRPNTTGGLGIHNPFVLAWSALPGVGLIAYIFSGPLRKPILMRLALDRALRGLPFGLYGRLQLGRIVPPRVRNAV